MVGILAAVGYLSINPFLPLLSPHPFAHREAAQLAYGGVSYVVAIAAAVLLTVLYERPEGLLKTFLVVLGLGLLGFPSMFGSIFIVAALLHVTGGEMEVRGVFFFGLCLWATVLLGIFLLVFVGRKLLHR
jgi:hypothetical protein